MDRTVLIVMLKSPEAGKVKTRLAAAVGTTAALRIYEELLRITLKHVAATNLDVWVALAGEEVPAGWDDVATGIIQQRGYDLGERMTHAVQEVLQQGYERWLILGGDCPMNTEENLKQAAERLRTHTGVIGGTEDGGYYLLGMHGFDAAIFDGIAWGTDQVYAQTMAQISAKGWHFVNLPVLRDVDTIDDLYGNHLGHLLPES